MARRKPDLAELEARIGHAFADRELLGQALTHVSAVGGAGGRLKTYQRLEFLGDRVLGVAVADMLYAAYPSADEGELSKRLAELVRRETCTEVALAWEVGPHLKLGGGEMQSGGRRNAAILADACEAIIGAVFSDAGYGAARAVVARAFGDRMHVPHDALRDPKTALQEWAQGRGLPVPAYALVGRSGPDHAPLFRIAVAVDGVELAEGQGASKRAAEQDAAEAMLIREGVWEGAAHA